MKKKTSRLDLLGAVIEATMPLTFTELVLVREQIEAEIASETEAYLGRLYDQDERAYARGKKKRAPTRPRRSSKTTD